MIKKKVVQRLSLLLVVREGREMMRILVSVSVLVVVMGMECDGPVHDSFFGVRGPYDE